MYSLIKFFQTLLLRLVLLDGRIRCVNLTHKKEQERLFLLFAFRFEKDTIPDFLDSLRDLVDGYIYFDDSGNKDTWYNEGLIRNKLLKVAYYVGVDWVICLDPDERIEKRGIGIIKDFVKDNRNKKVIGVFKFRELFEKDKYRVDGIWDTKIKKVLFPIKKGQKFQNIRLHSAWHPLNEDYLHIPIDVNIYHLKMIDPINREKRRQIYNLVDRNKVYQPIGYDYLVDLKGMILTKIPKGRDY